MIVRLFLAIYGILCLIGSTAKTVSTSFFQTDGETITISVKKTTPVKAVGDQSELPTSFQKYKTYSKLSNLLEAATDGGKGQFFMLSNGEYRDVGEFTLKCHGVTIMAKHDGKAVIRPHSKGLRIIIEGHNNTIKGFQFMYGSGVTGKAIIEVSGNRNILTNLNFYHMDATHYIKFNSGSKMNTLSHSNFEYKPSEAAAVSGRIHPPPFSSSYSCHTPSNATNPSSYQITHPLTHLISPPYQRRGINSHRIRGYQGIPLNKVCCTLIFAVISPLIALYSRLYA